MVAPPTLFALLEQGAPDQQAVVVPNRVSLSYRRLRDLVEEAAHALAAQGVGRGDRVTMVFPNGPEAILLFVAASMVGTACPLNAAYKEDEFRFYLEDVGARHLLVPPGEAEAARRAMPAGGTVIEAALDGDGRLHLNGAGAGKRRDSLDLSTAGDIGLVLHTSGTTSRPKKVPLLNENLTASVANIIATYELGPEDVSLCIMPLFHVHGLIASPRRRRISSSWPGCRKIDPRARSGYGLCARAALPCLRPSWPSWSSASASRSSRPTA